MRTRRLTLTLLLTALLAATLLDAAPREAASAVTAPALRLVWADEFSGAAGAAPSTANWRYQTGGGGWGNDELECYTSSRANSVQAGNGSLEIVARKTPNSCSGRSYSSARLSSQGLHASEYGRIEVRAILPTGAGIWPAIWLLGTNSPTVGWPAEGEIDIAEVFGNAPNTIHGTVHGPKANGSPYQVTGQMTAVKTTSSGYHRYGVTWSPAGIQFTYDDYVYFTATRAAVVKQGQWVFDHPFYALLNVAVGGSYGGPPHSTTPFPAVMNVDYIRAYEPV